MLLKYKDIPKDELRATYKEIDTFMKRDYHRIYLLSGAFMDDFPLDSRPVTRAYIAIQKAINMLPKEARLIINDHYIEPVPYYITSQKLKISRTTYYQRLKVACYMLARYLEITCNEVELNYREMIE